MRYICTGRVLPERVCVSFHTVEMNVDGGGHVFVTCDSSQLTVCLVDMPAVDGYLTAVIAAEDVSKIVVNAVGFAMACNYTVEITQVIEEDGTPHVLGVGAGVDVDGKPMALEPFEEIVEQAFLLSGRDIFFRLAIRDYLKAITDATDCATYCYRAIEGIKSAFVSKEGKDQWQIMHDTIGTDRTEIEDKVKHYADAVRHGNWIQAKPTTGVQRNAMVFLTREILRKYMELKTAEEPAKQD